MRAENRKPFLKIGQWATSTAMRQARFADHSACSTGRLTGTRPPPSLTGGRASTAMTVKDELDRAVIAGDRSGVERQAIGQRRRANGSPQPGFGAASVEMGCRRGLSVFIDPP